MGTLKLIKEDGHCSVEFEHEPIHDIMFDTAILLGGLIDITVSKTDISRETWLDWFRSEEFEDIIIGMAGTRHERRKGGDRHKKKSSCNSRRRSDIRRKV